MVGTDTIQSSVDWADYENGQLFIRNKNLSWLIKNSDFIETIFHSWIKKKPSANEKKMLNAVLVSFSGGWSFYPPVVMNSRLAASTKAPLVQCLAAGFCASGPAHAGAIEKAMEEFLDPLYSEKHIYEKLSKNEKIPGFGHPVVEKDPRPEILRDIARELDISGDALQKFDLTADILKKEKDIKANIDGVNGAILIDLGFKKPSFGPAMFLLGRFLSLTAHVIEEYENPPFHIYKILMPTHKNVKYTEKIS